MSRTSIRQVLLISIFFSGCLNPRMVSVWKAETKIPYPYTRILVACVAKEKDASFRIELESQIATRFSEIGYVATPFRQAYRPDELNVLDEEGTYLRLCQDGIDAVFVVAFVDKQFRESNKKGISTENRNSYYYERIRNYQRISHLMDAGHPAEDKEWICETILFDLNSLEPRCLLETKIPANRTIHGGKLADQIVSRMVKDKILISAVKQSDNLKAF